MVSRQRGATSVQAFGTKEWVLLAALASVGTADVAALTVTATAAGTKQMPTVVTAMMRRVDGDAPAHVLELPVGTSKVVDDPGDGTWEITSTSSTFWAAPVYASRSDAVTLQLWPLGSIGGKLSGRPPASGDLVVSFVPSTEPGPTGVVVCPFEGRDWRCSLPAGLLDMRFNLKGFATEFRWGVTVTDHVDISTLELTPGSSVFGKVQLNNRSTSELLKAVEVSLAPVNVDPARGRVRQYTSNPDARGFFQVRGLVPGSYSLHAQAKDLISETRPVEIIQGTNASLKEPLVLAKPARLSVRITPPLDTQEKRWQVMLLKMRAGTNSSDAIAQSLASTRGEWALNRALPGDYVLTIQQEDGAEWRDEEFTLRTEDGDRSIDIVLRSQRVSGKVTLGKRPIPAAKVRFAGENGPGLIADENGHFAGVFPSFKEDEVTLLVTSDTPDIQRTLVVKGERSPDGDVYFNVTLPATTITGRTINEDGSPEPSAIVTLSQSGRGRAFEQMFSDQDGTFQFEGFDPGTYALQADAFQKASAVVDFDASTDDVSSSHDLVLRPQEQVRGRVSMNGVPVAGADVYALPRDTKFTLLPQAKSDAAGLFVLALPPGTKTYDAIVIPRGFYITAARITRVPKEGLNVGVGQDGGSLSVDAPDDDAMLLLVHAGGEYSLSWLANASGGTTSSADGRRRLTIPHLESGQYSVCRKQKCQSVYVPRFAAATVTIDE